MYLCMYIYYTHKNICKHLYIYINTHEHMHTQTYRYISIYIFIHVYISYIQIEIASHQRTGIPLPNSFAGREIQTTGLLGIRGWIGSSHRKIWKCVQANREHGCFQKNHLGQGHWIESLRQNAKWIENLGKILCSVWCLSSVMAAGRTWRVYVWVCIFERESARVHACERDTQREKETKIAVVVEYRSNAMDTQIEKMSTYMYQRDEW